MPYVNVDKSGDDIEDCQPLLRDSDTAGHLRGDEGHDKSSGRPANTERSIWKANSKSRPCGRTKTEVSEHEDPRTSYKWSSLIRPRSDPDLWEVSTTSGRPIQQKPLKTCLKQKAKGTNIIPPDKDMVDLRSALKLRRIKTVDFEEVISKSLLPPGRSWSSAMNRSRSQQQEASKRISSCPGTATLTSRSPANPIMTRTDVHFIAIAHASSKCTDLKTMHPEKVEDADPATPTMQAGELDNSNYKVIWDDVPPVHSARTRGRSSSTSQALEAVGSTATRGVERVNTKLTEWYGTWRTTSDSFKPTIVVSPDDDDRRPQTEYGIMDDEDIEIFAPPNSERVSVVHSRHPSRPVSARMSRAAS